MTFAIGPYRFENRLALAPMAGVTDRPFRQLCRQLGAGMTVSEMISSRPTCAIAAKPACAWTMKVNRGRSSCRLPAA